MPNFEFEYNQTDKDLILSQTAGTFTNSDYIRLTIYPLESLNNIVNLPDNNQGVGGKAIFFASLAQTMFIDISPFKGPEAFRRIGTRIDQYSQSEIAIQQKRGFNDFKIFKNNDNIYIKPNDIFDEFALPQGDYKIQIDFLSQFTPKLDIVGVATTPGGGGVALGIGPLDEYFPTITGEENFIPLTNSSALGAAAEIFGGDIDDYLPTLQVGNAQFTNSSGTVFYFNTFPVIRKNEPNFVDITNNKFELVIKQISNSRKEVRIKLKNFRIVNDSKIKSSIINELNNNEPEFLKDEVIESETYGQLVIPNPNYKYQFKHILNIGNGNHIPIMNYTFDRITDGTDNQSLILKLYEPLPVLINTLDTVTIEKEVLTTQVQEIFYFSDVPDVFFGNGLDSDSQENWLNVDNDDFGFQNYNELSASIDDVTLNNLISQSLYDYPNLNTNFNEFSNHTFFSSAKKKLENFKTKVDLIQGYYSEISGTLSVSSSITGDSTFVIEKRKNLFNKITKELNSFTPYEKFLYYDGQSQTTASAPSLGQNLTPSIPVNLGGDGVAFESHNGFKNVYKHSSEKIEGSHSDVISLFSDIYHVHEKPFFNYSSSIYLSFLMQGDSGSILTYQNSNKETYNGLINTPLPQDTKFQNNILNPPIGDISSSIYKRYIFEASMSYFSPMVTINKPSTNNIINFRENSTDIEVLNDIKTGSLSPIKAYNGYSKLATQQVEPGFPFTGSIMPAGELFRIFTKNTLSSSLQGYWNIDDVESGSALTLANVVNDAGPTTGDATQIIGATASAGVEVHGRQYGTSFYIISASNGAPAVHEGIRFESSNLNFSKDDNFSMAIWVKRFHPNTGSADTTAPVGGDRQEVFMRGSTADSYGIDYQMPENKFRAGVRSGSATTVVTTSELADDGLNWHHVVFTYESGSSTGIKIYLDGVLENQGSNLGVGEFSSSSPSGTDALSIGETATISSNGRQFNGFLQYPRIYNRTITAKEVNSLYLNPPGITETKITDVKVTLKDPTDVLPFDTIFKTTSTEFTDWYNNALVEAETFDTNNIHSLENNLPEYIRESSDYQDMKDFLNLQGEQYDLIRNHIDSLATLNSRGYKQTNSPPNNTLPMLLSNMGYQAITPFSSSLSNSVGSYLSNVTSIDDIKNQTWRKILNNLIFIYKSKGTLNSVRGLLNVYGYPPDLINFQEFGGFTENLNGNGVPIIPDTPPSPFSTGTDTTINDLNLNSSDGNISFTSNNEKIGYYNFNHDEKRTLNLNWWMDNANANTIEFIYKHIKTSQTQTLLQSSGSGAQKLWDLRLLPSSDGISSSFEFRLNNSQLADNAIGGRSFSMSLAYNEIKDGQLWNIMLQRMTGSDVGVGAGIQEYRLHAALQDDKVIKNYAYVTMSISGGLAGGSTLGGKGFFANQNFIGSGSRNALSSSNLFVGENISGSLSEIKAWSTSLSTSKFRQRTINKNSTVGNTISSHKNELIYNFKLNENYGSSSISSSAQKLTIVDSSPKNSFRNYSFEKSSSLFTTSSIYGSDIVKTVKVSLQDNLNKANDNQIVINPKRDIVGDLSSYKSAVKVLTKPHSKPKIKVSNKLEIYRSPQTFINNYVLDNIGGFNLESLYGNPLFQYSSSYDDLETFKKEFFNSNEIKINVNEFIRAHESMFNQSIIDGLKSVVPASSTFGSRNANIGVEIKPTLLEKQKYENKKATLVVNPNTFTSSISPSPSVSPTIEFEKSGSVSILPTYNDSLVILPKSGSVSLLPTYGGSTVNFSKSGSISLLPTYDGSTIVLPVSGTNNFISTNYNKSFRNIHSDWGTGDDDTYFVNYASNDSGSDEKYNVRHIDSRFVFHGIMDSEVYSGSFGKETDYTNQSLFFNRVMLTEGIHANITYDSFIGGNPGTITGRMIGKTKYFITSSNGEITLPANHVSKYVDNFVVNMVNGGQNTNPGILNVEAEDYSTSSFYAVEIQPGEREIIVKGKRGSMDTNNRIQY